MSNKRSNPYLADFVPQSKVHVGLKQFNNNEDRLKKVYEKTLELLFKGSKRKTISSHFNEQCTATMKVDSMKQLFIEKDGTLSQTGRVVTGQLEKKLCICGNSKIEQCSYCEAPLCEVCQHACARCKCYFCINCSILRSDEAEECVSCYS